MSHPTMGTTPSSPRNAKRSKAAAPAESSPNRGVNNGGADVDSSKEKNEVLASIRRFVDVDPIGESTPGKAQPQLDMRIPWGKLLSQSSEVKGKAVMLDKIINYVQSLQQHVELRKDVVLGLNLRKRSEAQLKIFAEIGIALAIRVKEIKEQWLLTEEGKLYADEGSPEAKVFSAVPPEGILRADLEVGGF